MKKLLLILALLMVGCTNDVYPPNGMPTPVVITTRDIEVTTIDNISFVRIDEWDSDCALYRVDAQGNEIMLLFFQTEFTYTNWAWKKTK